MYNMELRSLNEREGQVLQFEDSQIKVTRFFIQMVTLAIDAFNKDDILGAVSSMEKLVLCIPNYWQPGV